MVQTDKQIIEDAIGALLIMSLASADDKIENLAYIAQEALERIFAYDDEPTDEFMDKIDAIIGEIPAPNPTVKEDSNPPMSDSEWDLASLQDHQDTDSYLCPACDSADSQVMGILSRRVHTSFISGRKNDRRKRLFQRMAPLHRNI